MQISKKGIEFLSNFEGLQLIAYPDPASALFRACQNAKINPYNDGYLKLFNWTSLSGNPWTIGYGTTSGVKAGDKITKEQALEFKQCDLKRFEDAVNNAVKVSINQNQFDAMVSLAYNIGAAAFANSTLVKRLNTSDYQGAADQFLVWDRAGSPPVPMAGLTRRRKEERAMFLESISTAEQKPSIENNALPYKVRVTASGLNIRTSARTDAKILRIAPKGEVLTVWAECSADNLRWGKDSQGFFALKYTEKI